MRQIYTNIQKILKKLMSISNHLTPLTKKEKRITERN